MRLIQSKRVLDNNAEIDRFCGKCKERLDCCLIANNDAVSIKSHTVVIRYIGSEPFDIMYSCPCDRREKL